MREKIRLNSSAGTGHFYTTTKNKRTTTEKIELINDFEKSTNESGKSVMYEIKVDKIIIPSNAGIILRTLRS